MRSWSRPGRASRPWAAHPLERRRPARRGRSSRGTRPGQSTTRSVLPLGDRARRAARAAGARCRRRSRRPTSTTVRSPSVRVVTDRSTTILLSGRPCVAPATARARPAGSPLPDRACATHTVATGHVHRVPSAGASAAAELLAAAAPAARTGCCTSSASRPARRHVRALAGLGRPRPARRARRAGASRPVARTRSRRPSWRTGRSARGRLDRDRLRQVAGLPAAGAHRRAARGRGRPTGAAPRRSTCRRPRRWPPTSCARSRSSAVAGLRAATYDGDTPDEERDWVARARGATS